MEAVLALLTLQNSWDSCKDWGHGEPQGRGFSWEVRPPAPLPGREALLCQTPHGPQGQSSRKAAHTGTLGITHSPNTLRPSSEPGPVGHMLGTRSSAGGHPKRHTDYYLPERLGGRSAECQVPG